MWIFLNDAMLSIVAPAPDTVAASSNRLVVRARLKGDIERVFPGAQVAETPGRDYRFRALISQSVVRDAMAAEVDRITYGNFKDSVEEKDRHDAYFGAWRAMHSLQLQRVAQEAPRPQKGKGKGKAANPQPFRLMGYP